ncbi:jasmonate-induced protein homolog [Silene latifolia]|uniref:jasmonate-induced protein homolog n=1 Tax=Silene latifolia TaxID=37657 RepID=UPI003D77CB96
MASIQVQKATSSDNKEVKQPQNGAQVVVVNQTKSVMTLGRQINWSGTPAYPGYPDTIWPNQKVIFNHLADGDFGSTAAVIYNGTNLTGQPCAWVLAWDAPAESERKPNKVFVTCGSKSQIDNLENNEIRHFLSESSKHSFTFDPAAQVSAQAIINEKLPNKAYVGAGFGAGHDNKLL